MQIGIYKKIISLLVALALTAGLALSLIACSQADGGNGDGDSADNSGNVNAPDSDGGDAEEIPPAEEDYHDKVMRPPYKDYDRATIDFDKMVYSRPNIEAINREIASVTETVSAAQLTYDEQIAAIEALEPHIGHVLTMNSFASLYNYKDSSLSFWCDEVKYFAENYSSLVKTVEELYVAAANSPYAERFEAEYFGDGLIEEYRDGGKYTDYAVKLLADEEALVAEYNALSSATVKITFAGETDTLDNILSRYKSKYGENSTEYLGIELQCRMIYAEEIEKISTDIFISLLKVRGLIAEELGYESYADYAYENYSRPYSPEVTSKFLEEIATVVVPVMQSLYTKVFYYYFQRNDISEMPLDVLMNNSYEILGKMNADFADIYAYMLQHGLYDAELYDENRYTGAFTTYLDKYEAPFIFMTANGDATDYSTLMHEFGHFMDAYIADGFGSDLDRAEIFSQALALLSTSYMDDKLSESDIQYLLYDQLFSALDTLIIQGFYARVEQLVYDIPSESLSTEGAAKEATIELLNAAVILAADEFGLNANYYNNISYVLIPHLFTSPLYVSSYCTAIVPALELFFMEREVAGAGVESFYKLIVQNEGEVSLEEALRSVGLSSPFDSGVLRSISDKIHYLVTGSHYYKPETATPLSA